MPSEGFVDRFAVGGDKARLDGGLRAGAAFEQAALDQQQVGALARVVRLPRSTA